MIQDMILTTCGIALAVPIALEVGRNVRRRSCPISLALSAPTAVILEVMALTAATVPLAGTAAIWTVTASLWGVVAVQRIRYNNRSTKGAGQ